MDRLQDVLRRKINSEIEVLYRLVIKSVLANKKSTEHFMCEVRERYWLASDTSFLLWFSDHSENGVYDHLFTASQPLFPNEDQDHHLVIIPGLTLAKTFKLGKEYFSFHDPNSTEMNAFIRKMIDLMTKHQNRKHYYESPSLR